MKNASVVCIMSILLTALALRAQEAPAAAQKTNYAVVNLKCTNGVTEGEAELITDRLRSELFNTGLVNVMERNQMQDILKEQGFQQSGACTDEACLVEMGQMLGVKVLVVGSLGKLGSMFMVNIRSIDVQTAQIIKVVSVDIKGGIEDVVGHLREIADKLTGTAPGGTIIAAPTQTPPAPAATVAEPPAESTPPPAAPIPETTPASEPAAKVEATEEKPVVDSKTDRNRNRGGVGLSFTLLPGRYRHTASDFSGTFEAVYLQLDSLLFYGRGNYTVFIEEGEFYDRSATPLMDFLIRFKIRAGSLFTVDVGPHFMYGSEIFTYTGYDVDFRELSLTYLSMGAQVGLSFVKRIFPLKINAGIFADITVPFISYEFSEEMYNSTYSYYETNSDSDVKVAFRVVPGARAGAEILAGPHVGFSFDFVFQWLNLDAEFDFDEMDLIDEDPAPDVSQTVGFPVFGIGIGVNFYF